MCIRDRDADIQTGEELTVLFGKIKKRFSTYDADGDGVVDRAAAADRVAKKFILQNNAGQQMAEFDGSADRTVQLTPGQVGAEPAFTKNNAFNKMCIRDRSRYCAGKKNSRLFYERLFFQRGSGLVGGVFLRGAK